MKVIQFRPILVGKEYDDVPIWKKLNSLWILQRIPMLLFAIVSSYGVGKYLYISDIPIPIAILGSISFDVGFLGVIAIGDMQIKKTWANIIAYYAINIAMSGLAALFNVLSHSNGKYADITWEHVTAGAPFALVGLIFALFYHTIMSQHMDTQLKQDIAEKEHCEYCNLGKPTRQAINSHYRYCDEKLAGQPKRYKTDGTKL
jgi:hypothetical protein